ncbi:hypothetical protein [Thiomonas intermedia]|uniref:hypothetical protein n=1 Tax=Thiomonas intermedia TaxID=926 RepID=UPI003CCB95A2
MSRSRVMRDVLLQLKSGLIHRRVEGKVPLTKRHGVWTQDRAADLAGVERPDALPSNARGQGSVGPDIGRFLGRIPRPTHAAESCGVTDIRTSQELLGHSDVSTTMIYAPVPKVAAGGAASPLDRLLVG